MDAIFSQLGVNGKLLLSQGVNFFIVLAVLTFFVWRPLLVLIHKRREKIEEGIRSADTADERLKNIAVLEAKKILEADAKALVLITDAEKNAKSRAGTIIKRAEQRADNIEAEAWVVIEHKKAEELEALRKHAAEVVREALAKAVSAHPAGIDEKLIIEAAGIIEKETSL